MQKYKLVPILFLFLIPIVFFHKVLLGLETFYLMDVLTEEIPNHIWTHRHFGSLWNPHLFTGQPHLANPQSYFFDIFHFFSFLFSPVWGFGCFIVSHFFVASLGTYLLFRSWKFSPLPALFAGFLFTYGGYFISLGPLPILLNTVTYIPWILLCHTKVLQSEGKFQKALPYCLLTGIGFALQWFAGEPQLILMTLSILFLLPFWIKKSSFQRGSFFLLLAFLVGIFLAAIQILPFYIFLEHSNRQEPLLFNEATKWSLKPETLWSLLFPHRLVNPKTTQAWGIGYWEDKRPFLMSIHLGVLSLISLGFCLFRQDKTLKSIFKQNWIWFFFLFLGLAWSLGKYSPIYEWTFSILPPFRNFRFPEKFFFFCHISLCVLASMGFEQMTRWLWPKNKLKALVIIITILCLFLWVFFSPIFSENLFNHLSPLSFWRRYFSFQILLFLVLLLLYILGLAYIKDTTKRSTLFIGLFLLEMVVAHYYVNPTLPIKEVLNVPKAAKWIKKRSPHARLLTLAEPALGAQKISRVESLPQFYLNKRKQLSPPTSMEFDLNDVNSIFSFHLDEKEAFDDFLDRNFIKTVQIFGIDYIVSAYPLQKEGFRLMFQEKGDVPVFIYQLEKHLPSLYIVNKWHHIKEKKEVMDLLMREDFDPFKEAIIRGETTDIQKNSNTNMTVQVHDVSTETDRFSAKVEVKQKTLLVMTQSFYPGWRVMVNGIRKPLLEINGFFQGVFLEKGNHQVTFEFKPKSFFLGLGISIFSWFLVLFLIGLSWIRQGN